MKRRELLTGLAAAFTVTALPALGADASIAPKWQSDAKLVKLIEDVKASTIPLLHIALFECNSHRTRKRFRHQGSKMLFAARKEGVIQDFRTVCNKTNNTDERIANGEFIVDYLIKPKKNGDRIMMRFAINRKHSHSYVLGLAPTSITIGSIDQQDPYARKHFPPAIDISMGTT